MPKNIQTYTTCASPEEAKSHKNYGGVIGAIMVSFLTAKPKGKAGFVFLYLAILALVFSNPISGALGIALIVAALVDVTTWYYHYRLLCVGQNDSCLIGTVLGESHNSFDGDATFNIFPAPYRQMDCWVLLREHITANRDLLVNPDTFEDPPFTFVDDITNHYEFPDDPFNLKLYLDELGGEPIDGIDADLRSNVYNHLLIGFLDRLLKLYDGQNFYSHFLRKDRDYITDVSTWDAIPQDYDDTKDWTAPNASFYEERFENRFELPEYKGGLNPMFRFANKQQVPFVHCEIDGNNVSILLSLIAANLIGLSGVILGFMLLPPPLNLLLFLAWLLALLVSLLGDAGAENPDFEFEDPEPLIETAYLEGDVVAVYGKWIMDTEHGQYFEIHPVKAYYTIGREGSVFQIFDSSKDLKKNGATSISNEEITREIADEICQLIHGNEKNESEAELSRSFAQVLSYGLVTKYGGGGY